MATTIRSIRIMSRQTARPEFAALLKSALNGISIQQASYKTGVSYEYMRTMVAYGRIPSEEILQELANGLNVSLEELRIAAGYAPSVPDNLPDFTTQAIHNLRMLKGSKRPSNEEIEEAKRKIVAEFDRMESEHER